MSTVEQIEQYSMKQLVLISKALVQEKFFGGPSNDQFYAACSKVRGTEIVLF